MILYMINLAYSLSAALNKTLSEIDQLKLAILLFSITPKSELNFRWEARLHRLNQLHSANNLYLTKQEIEQLLVTKLKKKLTFQEQELINYQQAFDYIYENWLANQEIIQPQDILELYEICSKPSFGAIRDYQKAVEQLSIITNYLSHGKEHPVVKAAVSFIGMLSISPFLGGNEKIASLSSYLYLYKEGFDIRGFLYIEDFLIKDANNVSEELKQKRFNLTDWIEKYAQNFLKHLQRISEKVSNNQQDHLVKHLTDLNDRQKEILKILENPQINITNNKVQKNFKVSQITASRDLAKLANLGLIFAHGKGRSIYYIKL